MTRKQHFNPYTNPIWLMYECERGKRFTAVKGGGNDYIRPTCEFSGCLPDHTVKVVGETSDRDTAHNWFRR